MKKITTILLALFLLLSIIVFAERPNRPIKTGISDFEPVEMGKILSSATSDWYIIDSTFIDYDFVSTGNIFVIGDGLLIVDDAMLTMNGTIAASDNGRIIICNGAHLHFNQYWVGQYYVYLMENSSFESIDATIDANGVMHYAELHDSSHYSAIRTHFPDWTFRKIFEKSSMYLEDVGHVGDFFVGDSTDIHLVRCDTLMPWLQALDGSIIDIEFPDPDSVDHFEAGEGAPGFSGMGYHFTVDTCARCWWSFETFTGCSVTVHNSEIYGSCVRFNGGDTTTVFGICNYNMHDEIMPLPDRHLEYDNTYVCWWNWYPLDNTVLFMDSCVFGEMIPKNQGKAYVTRSTHDGATIVLSTQDSSFMFFADGTSEAYLSTFKHSVMLLENTRVTPVLPWLYQAVNIAHDRSMLLCINCDFDTLPFALDTAVVFYAAIDSLDTIEIGEELSLTGNAWLSVGPHYPHDFDSYTLSYRADSDSTGMIIEDSCTPVRRGILGTWDTESLAEGDYILTLVLRNTNADTLVATMDVYLTTMSIDEKPTMPNDFTLSAHPNPFNSAVTITIDVPVGAYCNTPLRIEVFDINGRRISVISSKGFQPDEKSLTDARKISPFGRNDIAREFVWQPDESTTSGVYLVRATGGDETMTKRVVYLK